MSNFDTLFLDRDGVINVKLEGKYVQNFSEFEFISGSLSAISKLSQLFFRIIIITNQQGIGKGIMTQFDLNTLHFKMQQKIEDYGGRIDKIYYCPHLESDNCLCRKPKPGMILEAKKKYKIDLNSSFLIGDRFTDIQAAKNTGCKSIFIDRNYNEKKPIFQEANVKNILSAVNFIKKIYSTKKYE